MARHVWLIPVQPVADQVTLFSAVLRRLRLECTLVPVDRLDDPRRTPPTLAVLHGGPTTPELLDGLKALMRLAVPTMVVVSGLTDRLESLLLDRGAQDVLALPTAPELIASRLEAMGRVSGLGRHEARMPSTVRILDDLEVHPARRAVFVDGRSVDLTKTEFDLLLHVCLHPGEVVTRAELARATAPVPLTARALESHISRLRAKLLRAGARSEIRAVRGIGYRCAAQDTVEEPNGVAGVRADRSAP